ncbi:trypsin-like peptidase domain-containing protein [Amedibacillus dolichus]|uniref:Trypsin-like peptidase domain-containing protein n=1 Tax=Amedibacillus dolichus TaxID=31971 RepID=A0ABT7UDN9_9FIRM|nr:trypsin-like peptidase domain-containing protein [Amedibacillus dolichus]MDM8157746.1 trypsin-like peptidase domain-containing protein [Amedibacillus dolichus]
MNEDNRLSENEFQEAPQPSPEKPKRAKRVVQLTWGKLTAIIACCLVLSIGCGIGGAYLIARTNPSSVIYQDTSKIVSTGSQDSSTIKSVVEQCANSVVEIQTESVTNGSNPFQQYVSSGAGSGVILTQDGYIVTNHHVIEDANTITVRTRSGDEYTASLVGSDEQSDLAVLKIDAAGLTPAVLGDSTTLEVGDLAIAIGNPLGELGGSVTSGIISALDREMTIDGQTMTLLQTDAAVNPGNSGGGLFNANGDLIGIVNAKSSGENVEGIGFAIPISTATDIIDELIANGEVTSRPTLGVSLYNVEDEMTASQLGVDSTGVYIVQIVDGGAADNAGLRSGDRIVSVDGSEVSSASDVRAALNKHKIGESISITVERNGQTQDFDVAL